MKIQTHTERKLNFTAVLAGIFLAVLALAHADDSRTNSWLTTYAGKYARIYTTDANRTNGVAVTTWSNGSQSQNSPAYCGVQEIYSSSNYVYIRSTGLGAHTMGPWYLNAAHTTTFPNYPANQKAFFRIPRTVTIPATKTQTALGTIGFFVDGIAMFDSADGFVWTGSAESGSGTGYWHREAYANEGVTFDPGFAHQENTGNHHYHGDPIALRYLLGDHVDFNATTKIYSESGTAPTKHSPILAWVKDGLPVYGPYGYSVATNPASGVRRMLSGFVLRNGQNGTDNLTNTARATIPAWAQRLYSVAAAQAGPALSTTYPIARYMEDYAYLGDLLNTNSGLTNVLGVDFDLNEYNVRWCVTPEFPDGTYAYFVSMETNGVPKYPNNIGRAYYASPTGGAVTNFAETVMTNLLTGPNASPVLNAPTANNGAVKLTWGATEGGTYMVQSTTNFSAWTTNSTNVAAVLNAASFTNNPTDNYRFYRVARTALATYDPVSGTSTGGGGTGILSVSPTSGNRGTTFTLTINLDATVGPPPANAPINSITVGSITGTGNVHVSQTQVTSSITIPAGAATGAQTVTVVFPGPPANPTATVTYTLTSGFTIN